MRRLAHPRRSFHRAPTRLAACLCLFEIARGSSALAEPVPTPDPASPTAAETSPPASAPSGTAASVVPATSPAPAAEPAASDTASPTGTPLAAGTTSAPAAAAPGALLQVDASAPASALPDQARNYAVPPGVEDEDVVLALPRAVLLLPRLAVSVVFWPIDQLAVLVDDNHLLDYLDHLLYFDDRHEFGWSPTLSYASSFGPTVGAKLFHKSLFGHGENARLSAQYLGRYVQSYDLRFEAERLGGSRAWFELRGRFEAESGALFSGIGINRSGATGPMLDPRGSQQRSYFAQDRALGLLRAGYTAGEIGSLVKLGATAVFNQRNFARNTSDKAQTQDLYDTTLLPGWNGEVRTLELQLNLITDLRSNRGLTGDGFYFEGFAGIVPKLDRYGYVHYGAELSYTIDLYHHTRLLTFRTALESVHGAQSEIPFSDLPRLGGADRLRGYVEGRFRDRHATLASVEYRYPIHKNVEGELFVDAGYVSRRYRDLYDLRDWKLGYGGGLVFGGDDSVMFRVDIAYGDALQVTLTGGIPSAFDGRSTQL